MADGGRFLSLRYDTLCGPNGVTGCAKGADGERRLGRVLDEIASANVRVLHGRRIPGSRANIDHLVVNPEGVFVIDAKNFAGPVGLRDRGTLLRARPTLYANGRDQTKLVDGTRRQVDAVRAVVGPGVPIHPVICYIAVEWLTWSKHFELDGVLVTAWTPLRRRLTRSRSWTDQIDVVAAHLTRTLEPATARKARVRPPA